MPSAVQDVRFPDAGVPSAGVVSVGEVNVLLVSVSVVARPTNVSVVVGSVNVPVLLMLEIIGLVSVLFVSVVVLVAVTTLVGVMIPDNATVAMGIPLRFSECNCAVASPLINLVSTSIGECG